MILCPVALLVVPSFPESCSPSARPTVFTHSLVGAFGVISYLTAYFFDSKIDEMDPHGAGLLVVGSQTLLEGFGVVVRTLDEGFAGLVIGHGLLGRVNCYLSVSMYMKGITELRNV